MNMMEQSEEIIEITRILYSLSDEELLNALSTIDKHHKMMLQLKNAVEDKKIVFDEYQKIQ